MAKSTVDISKADEALAKIVRDVGIDGKRIVAKEMQEMAVFNFPQAVFRFYPEVLRVRTGRLRQSFTGFAEQAGDGVWRVGMRSRNVEYARIQHDGGQINRGNPILPRNKKALFWEGAEHPVRRVNNPGFIPATKFFEKPMSKEVVPMIKRIKDKIGFRR